MLDAKRLVGVAPEMIQRNPSHSGDKGSMVVADPGFPRRGAPT